MRLVVDIDDTIIYSYILSDGNYVAKGCNKPLVAIINKLYKAGHDIILHTGRHWNHLRITERQLKKYNIKYTTLIMGKPIGDYYIDDKGLTPEQFIKEVKKNVK